MDAQRTADTRQLQQDEHSAATEAPQLRSMPEDSGAAVPLPLVPEIASPPTAAQAAFDRFHCTSVDRPSAQCAALAVLEADSRFEPGSAAAPELRLNAADGRYTEGQTLALTAKASAQFDGYLYVDYFDEQGNVIHLRPGRYSDGLPVKAGAWVDLGGRDYVVYPPFGTDLLVAIATPRPLFERDRPILEQATQYLPALQARLREMGGDDQDRRPASSYAAIVTLPRWNKDL